MITNDALAFLAEPHLATLSTIGRDGRIHAVPVGITYDAAVVRIIGNRGSQKFLNVRRTGRASVCTVDVGRWVSFEGPARVDEDPAAIARAVELYAAKYRTPQPNPERAVIELAVERVLGSPQFRA